jgi:hypothetical protein
MVWLTNRLPTASRPGLLTRCQPSGSLPVVWLERGASANSCNQTCRPRFHHFPLLRSIAWQ